MVDFGCQIVKLKGEPCGVVLAHNRGSKFAASNRLAVEAFLLSRTVLLYNQYPTLRRNANILSIEVLKALFIRQSMSGRGELFSFRPSGRVEYKVTLIDTMQDLSSNAI